MKPRHINWRNLGWLVSTLLHWFVAAPFTMWYVYKLFVHHIVPDTTAMLVFSGIIIVWYNIRNRNIGYGLTYLKNWMWDRDDKEWQARMRSKRIAEYNRSAIEHHRNEDNRIAK